MRIMADAVVMKVVVLRQTSRVQFVMAFRHGMIVMLDRRLDTAGVFGDAFYRDGRKRPNRQAQSQQQDDEEFAPI